MVSLPQPCPHCGTPLYNYNAACHNPECKKPVSKTTASVAEMRQHRSSKVPQIPESKSDTTILAEFLIRGRRSMADSHYRVTWGRNMFRPTEWCVMEEVGVNIISSGPYRWSWQARGTAAWKRFKQRVGYCK
jgi:hypothetical protein